jgi:fumarate hydratase class II
MTHETWIFLGSIALSNLIALVGALIHVATKLSRIETDVKWIKGNCPRCQPTLENPSP